MKYFYRCINTLFLFFTATILLWNYFLQVPFLPLFVSFLFLLFNIFPFYEQKKFHGKRLRICAKGCELLYAFLFSLFLLIPFLLWQIPNYFPGKKSIWLWNLLVAVLVEACVFWNGLLRIYCTSAQLGIKWRVIGAVCGWIPVINLLVLRKLMQLSLSEAVFESEKINLTEKRKGESLCATKYPILLVHGVFFRDFKYFNYWGRIPGQLEKNGAKIFYGNHQSAASVKDSAKELRERILQILKETGAKKINVIAHSKGGLDMRYAISRLGMDEFVASLTTINTPHRGCEFADYLLSKIPVSVKEKVADTYNQTLKKFGDSNPDFLAAVKDLTASSCRKFNQKVPDKVGVYYQSVGSKVNSACGGRFPLNFSYALVKYFDGANDGLVSEQSFPWGADYQLIQVHGKRGVSHGDMIDLNRENIPEFDVREFYVGLVHELKERGY